ncbi:MAG TPA: AVAST type 4 anti-phage nuclease Avs4 [Candidatus Saccharimonadales bacterium]|nr:AVAST type 4 anti-phage nuclease Avs4 [Candidatus Saccharimonadales bacterium]
MQEVNWSQFNAKFNGRQDKVFEWLCYLLFCIEYQQPLGIIRYKNQPGIETDPIKVGVDWIGWQAKFFATKLSEHVKDFTDSIDTTKKLYPHITKLTFYTNGEFSQDKGKAQSTPKEKIEAHATSKGMSIIWKEASSFVAPSVARDNAVLIKYFFSAERSTFDLIAELNQHTESILGSIRSTITFNGELKIDRSDKSAELTKAIEGALPIVMSGDGGVGKTAVIKDLYDQSREEVPIFVFKASEFNNLTNVNNLFKPYGDFNASDFATAYSDAKIKCIVIDSAEKLSDIDDKDVFREFLRLVIDNNWQIIFTTRRSYMDDLKIMLIDSYNLGFQSIDIRELTIEELESLAKKHSFNLPSNDRMVDLIRNPFYLNEYLKNYGTFAQDVTYTDFKKLLWNKHIADTSIKKSSMHIRREDSFIELAKRRADQGSFSVDATGIDDEALGKLLSNEVIGYDENARQYFITHDIYEEWALDKVIETAFHRNKGGETSDFFNQLGESLPVRRAFRNWLSNKLVAEKDEVRNLIENSIANKDITSFWRDEVLVSVLLSEDAKSFFDLVEKDLLADDGKLLVRITFLLRIACKTIDEEMLQRLGIKRYRPDNLLQTMFTAPRGSGWQYLIQFIDDRKESLGLKNWAAILAMLADWNSKHQSGETTKHASQIALFYYNSINNNGGLGYRSRDLESKLIRVILTGSSEIKTELSSIVDQITNDKSFNHRSIYYSLAEAMLSSLMVSANVARAIPEKIIELAQYLWMLPPPDGSDRFDGMHDIEQYFGISAHHQDYYPSSALQTPITTLLQVAQQKTIDFIIDFTNKATKAYENSELSQNETESIHIHISKEKTVTQVVSYRLWEIYRGTHVAPSVLESVHMALEKWLLEYAKTAPQEDVENLCIYLLERSKSASITAVVVSVVISQPFKLFEIAAILFRTKELFFYDKGRLVKDQTHKSGLEMLRDNFPQKDFMVQIHQDERIKACDDPHRKNELENVAVYYQFFQPNDQAKKESEAMQNEIWEILDEHYKALPDPKNETEQDKVWRLHLARMDRRKMHPTTEKKDGQTLISFNPELDRDLKDFSEAALKKNNESQKYLPLKLWASYRWKKEPDKYKTYDQYENDICLAISETKEIIEKFKSDDENAQIFDSSTPAYVCSVLVRDFADKLTPEDKLWCRDVIFDFASRLIEDDYGYQVSDGTEPAINALPFLSGISKEDDGKIANYLLVTLFNRSPASSGQSLSSFALVTILHNLWKIDPKSANSLFLGFISLQPKYELLRGKIREENIKKKIYQVTEEEVLKALDDQYAKEIELVQTNKINYADIAEELNDMDIHALETAFELLPYGTKDEEHKKFLAIALPRLAKRVFDDDERFNDGNNLIEKLVHFILTSPKEDIAIYLAPFIQEFSESGDAADLLGAFLSAADKLDRYEEFWTVWNLLYAPVVAISKQPYGRSSGKQVIRNYLLAWQYWKESAREWYILKDREKAFYKRASNEMGSPVTVLYSLAKVLYDIGSSFAEDGIVWVNDLLENNTSLYTEDLEVNTVYHLEHVLRRYVSVNRQKIKSTPALKKRVIKTLDFLIEKTSIAAYIMREDIL